MASTIFEVNANNLEVSEYFKPLPENPDHSFVTVAKAIERDAKIEDHPFFKKAAHDRNAMILWTTQEAIVTNPFSQVLFRVISNIKNVHIRSILLPVVYGEHSNVKKGMADKSHPWLLWKLCKSLNIQEDDIKPTQAIIDFLKVLESSIDNTMYALGVLGIGNEEILLAEYRAVEACFDSACPEVDYRDFLQANIGEDEVHSQLMGDAAAAMAAMGYGYNPDDFIAGAKAGVLARIRYYDSLLLEIY